MIFAPLYPVIDKRTDPRPQRAIKTFAKLGDQGEAHSSNGLVLHHILNHCVENAVGFVLEFDPARGYRLKPRQPQ